MPKELPYFQFEPAVYLTGSIQMCSLEAQGLFVNIMCLYWQRNCSLTTDQINSRFNRPELLKELISHGIVKIIPRKSSEAPETISILFLKRQFKKQQSLVRKNSENGKKGAEKKWRKPKTPEALNSDSDRHASAIDSPKPNDSESIAIRREEKRRDKIRIEKKKGGNACARDFPKLEDVEILFQEKNPEAPPEKNKKLAGKFFHKYQSVGWMIGKSKIIDWKSKVEEWILNQENFETKNGTEKNIKPASRSGARQSFADDKF